MDESKEQRETEVPEFSNEEVLDVIHVVDTGPKQLEKLTPENIRNVISKGVGILKTERQEIIPQDYLPSRAFLEYLVLRSSQPHAIQCSVNGVEDEKTFLRCLEAYSEEHGIQKEDKDLLFVRSFIERRVKAGEALTKLFGIEISRRIGLAKNDDRFFDQEVPNFYDLVPTIEEGIQKFKEANKGKIEATPGLTAKVDQLENNLKIKDGNVLKEIFYKKICLGLSELTFIDFEEINEDDLARSLTSLEGRMK